MQIFLSYGTKSVVNDSITIVEPRKSAFQRTEKGDEEIMSSQTRTGFTVLLLVASTLKCFIGFASAQPTEVVAGGELEYQHSCAVCHGLEGRGDGVMRRYLTVQPANLRQLGRNNGGKFPFWEVYHKIDGLTQVPAHGTREMPIWGDRFRAEAGNDGKAAITQAAGRILSLTFYLEHIQE